MRNLLTLFITIIGLNIHAQKTKVAQWFLDDVQRMAGEWIADNAEFVSEQEPYRAYSVEWIPGIDNQSLTGKLHGIMHSGKRVLFWEFRQYWDNEAEKAVLLQFGNGNTMGRGKLYPINDNKIEAVQTFSLADGRKWVEKHESTFYSDSLITTSFEKQPDDTWRQKRTYTWVKENKQNLGVFSMSLAVKDLQKSKEFYEDLGFEVEGGQMEQKWLILKSNAIKLGLFQGMFPANTITFNPENARQFYHVLKRKGITMLFEHGMDKEEGACSFSFLDPDGTPILIDQHK